MCESFYISSLSRGGEFAMYLNLVFRPSKCEQAYCRVSYRKEQHAQSMQTRLTDKNRWKCAADMAFALRKRTDGGNALRPINDNISSGSTPTRAPASCFQCCQLRRRWFSLYVHGPPVCAACYHWLCDVVVTEHREGTDDRVSGNRACGRQTVASLTIVTRGQSNLTKSGGPFPG